MIALVILTLMAGVALGVVLMGILTAGRREDDCRACGRRDAFPADAWCDKVEDESAPRIRCDGGRGACPQPDCAGAA